MEYYSDLDGNSKLSQMIATRNSRANQLAKEIANKTNKELVKDIKDLLSSDLEKAGVSEQELYEILGIESSIETPQVNKDSKDLEEK